MKESTYTYITGREIYFCFLFSVEKFLIVRSIVLGVIDRTGGASTETTEQCASREADVIEIHGYGYARNFVVDSALRSDDHVSRSLPHVMCGNLACACNKNFYTWAAHTFLSSFSALRENARVTRKFIITAARRQFRIPQLRQIARVSRKLSNFFLTIAVRRIFYVISNTLRAVNPLINHSRDFNFAFVRFEYEICKLSLLAKRRTFRLFNHHVQSAIWKKLRKKKSMCFFRVKKRKFRF